ncbi:MAG TPA: hypothetical protein VG164_03685 [Trebonia sp.]|nr:hypothetical protein [Trebonia sp.]
MTAHDVLRLLAGRAESGSQPGQRADGLRIRSGSRAAACAARSRRAWRTGCTNPDW